MHTPSPSRHKILDPRVYSLAVHKKEFCDIQVLYIYCKCEEVISRKNREKRILRILKSGKLENQYSDGCKLNETMINHWHLRFYILAI